MHLQASYSLSCAVPCFVLVCSSLLIFLSVQLSFALVLLPLCLFALLPSVVLYFAPLWSLFSFVLLRSRVLSSLCSPFLSFAFRCSRVLFFVLPFSPSLSFTLLCSPARPPARPPGGRENARLPARPLARPPVFRQNARHTLAGPSAGPPAGVF